MVMTENSPKERTANGGEREITKDYAFAFVDGFNVVFNSFHSRPRIQYIFLATQPIKEHFSAKLSCARIIVPK
jgi:hypothetical protein